MTARLDKQMLARTANLVAAPVAPATPRACTDRGFELPTALYVATIGSYLAFLAIMAVGFQSRDMLLPMVIFTVYIAMLFGVPTLWARMQPETATPPLTLRAFWDHGIHTYTGHNRAGAAATQVLLLPVMVLLWGIAVVVIAATV
ncbi:hypothetical protein [Sphingomonas sp.]|uniref:hypothetical protein n=1 Tax=Sphingomonas sp. TaxID=28214 RepID=UPI00286A1CB8|nr:hypothetical protein [Sphingomonas sp.]